MSESMFDPARLRDKVSEHRALAGDCADPSERDFHVAMARAQLLLSMNAEWITSTDATPSNHWRQPSRR